MKQKKPSSLERILNYAGGHKSLTILGCILSALSAVLGLAPVSVRLAGGQKRAVRLARSGRSRGSEPLGLDGGVDCRWQHPAVLRRTHVHTHRGLPHRPEHPARRHDPCAEAAAGLFYGKTSRGGCASSSTNNAGLTEDLLAHKLPDLAATAVTPIAAIVVLFLFDWRMGLLCLLTMVLALLAMCMMMGGKNAGFFHRYQQEIRAHERRGGGIRPGHPVVKIFQQTVYSFKASTQPSGITATWPASTP